jgi:hypothetical protein
MCLPAGTNDRINGAGREAFNTPNTTLLVDDGNQRRSFNTVGRIERKRFAMKQASECRYGRTAARWALIDLSDTAGDCRRIRAAPVVATARALCLWKKGVDVVRECHHVTRGTTPATQASSALLQATRRLRVRHITS